MNTVLRTLQQRLAVGGFDVFHPFPASLYGRMVRLHNLQSDSVLKETPINSENGIAVLVGNSKHLWPVFKATITSSYGEQYLFEENPLDAYTEAVIHESCGFSGLSSIPGKIASPQIKSAEQSGRCIPVWVHKRRANKYTFAVQRLAAAAGIAPMDRVCGLNIHKTFGPWMAWRALLCIEPLDSTSSIVVDPIANEPSLLSPSDSKYWYDSPNEVRIKALLDEARTASSTADVADAQNAWRKWANIRGGFTEFMVHRYCEEQLGYHSNSQFRQQLIAALRSKLFAAR